MVEIQEWMPIKLLTRCKNQWEVDTDRCKSDAVSKIQILKGTCLKNMTWDPMELGWKTLKGTIQFFQYSSKLDRCIL